MEYSQYKAAHEIAPLVFQANITNDTCPAFIVQYVPLLGASAVSSTACTIAYVQGGDMTFLVDAAAPAGVDAIGTSGVISAAAAAYDTVGEMVNYINGLGPYRAICLVDPATLMANVLAKTAASCVTAHGLVFYLDTSVADTTYIYNIPITGEFFSNNGKNGHFKDATADKGGDEVCNYFHYCEFLQNFTSAATLYVKAFKQGDTSATVLYTKSLTDNTLMQIGSTANPMLPFLTAPPGYMLTVEVRSDLMSTAPTSFRVLSRSVPTVGGGGGNRIVRAAPHLL